MQKLKKKKGKKYFCKLHNKPEQNFTCKEWPFSSNQAFFKSVDAIFGCGYWFYEFDTDMPQPLG